MSDRETHILTKWTLINPAKTVWLQNSLPINILVRGHGVGDPVGVDGVRGVQRHLDYDTVHVGRLVQLRDPRQELEESGIDDVGVIEIV